MTTMDSDSESQDSDDGRRFRFEATRKDNVQPEPKLGKLSRSKSDYKSTYNDVEYKDRKEKSKHDSSRREHRCSKERDVDNRDLKYSAKYSKHISESRSSRREDSKDYRNARDVSVDSKSSSLPSKRKTSDAKRHRTRDRSEHCKHRSQERSHSRNEDDRSQNDKHKNKLHEKYKHHSREKSRDRGYQSHKTRLSDHSRSRGESERHDSHKRTSAKEDAEQHVQEFSSPKNVEQSRSDTESLTKKDLLSVESPECKDLDLSEFDVLSETDENLSDGSDINTTCSFSRLHKTKTKKQNASNECDSSTKKQAIESECSEGSPKVNAGKSDLLYGSSINDSGTISDSASPVLTEITEDSRDNVGQRCDRGSTENTVDVNSREESMSSIGRTSLRLSICDNEDDGDDGDGDGDGGGDGDGDDDDVVADGDNSPGATDISTAENNSTYGPVLPPQLIPDSSNDIKPVKSAPFIGPCLPGNEARNATELLEGDATNPSNENITSQGESGVDSDMLFGPVLPPHLLEKKCTNKTETKIIGPGLSKSPDNDEIGAEEAKVAEEADSDDKDAIGPLPANHPALKSNYVYRQLEQRAQQIRNEQKDEDDDTLTRREEWMTELPAAQIGNLGLAPRKFRVREGPDMSDRSCWTDTPAKKAEKQKQREEEKFYTFTTSTADPPKESYETESGKGRKRDKSLLEIHQSKCRKKKKKEEEKAKLSGQTAVRRPFDRDIDLQVNRFDQAQKNAIISKAQYLDERFSHGKI